MIDIYPAANLAQEEGNIEELRRLLDLLVAGLDITHENAYQLLAKVATLCYEVIPVPIITYEFVYWKFCSGLWIKELIYVHYHAYSVIKIFLHFD